MVPMVQFDKTYLSPTQTELNMTANEHTIRNGISTTWMISQSKMEMIRTLKDQFGKIIIVTEVTRRISEFGEQVHTYIDTCMHACMHACMREREREKDANVIYFLVSNSRSSNLDAP